MTDEETERLLRDLRIAIEVGKHPDPEEGRTNMIWALETIVELYAFRQTLRVQND